MRELTTNRAFRLLLAGQTLSLFGDTAMLLVMGMWAKQLTGSTSMAGAVMFTLAAPGLLAPLGGILVDRLPRRPLMIAVDLMTAACVLALLLVHERGDLWILYAVAFAYGASMIVFQSARLALLDSMLPAELLGQANALLRTMRESLRLVGPLAGAALFAGFGGAAVAVLDAATFLASALALGLMRVPETRPERAPRGQRPPVLREAMAGLAHVRHDPMLRQVVVLLVAVLAVFGFGESVFFAVVDEGLHRPVAFVGVLGSVQGVGAVLTGIGLTVLIRRTGLAPLVGLGLLIIGIGSLLTMSSNLAVVAGGVALVGAGLPMLVVAVDTLIQQRTPNRLQGRVATAVELLTGTPYTLSIAAGALLVAVVDYRLLLLAMSVVPLLGSIWALLRLREPDAVSPASIIAGGVTPETAPPR